MSLDVHVGRVIPTDPLSLDVDVLYLGLDASKLDPLPQKDTLVLETHTESPHVRST